MTASNDLRNHASWPQTAKVIGSPWWYIQIYRKNWVIFGSGQNQDTITGVKKIKFPPNEPFRKKTKISRKLLWLEQIRKWLEQVRGRAVGSPGRVQVELAGRFDLRSMADVPGVIKLKTISKKLVFRVKLLTLWMRRKHINTIVFVSSRRIE